jgi:hypothetical protein
MLIEPESKSSSPELKTLASEDQRSFWTRGIAILFAIALTAALLIGYMALRRRHAERLRSEEAAQNPPVKPALPTKVQLFVDDAMIKGSQVVIGGLLYNVSQENLSNLEVELELKRRKDGRSEKRTLTVDPRDLAPNEQGRYALSVPSGEYRESRVVNIRSGSRLEEVGFKSVPGAQRPPERTPSGKTIIVKNPSRGKEEEFINTPDSPQSVP